MKGVPRDYKRDPELRAAYEEGGRAIGKMILHFPDREEYFWKLVKGLELWPRWYLRGFRGLYAEENPREHRAVIKRQYRLRKREK